MIRWRWASTNVVYLYVHLLLCKTGWINRVQSTSNKKRVQIKQVNKIGYVFCKKEF